MDLSDEAVFRLRLDVIRLNRENQELRRRLKIPLNGLAIPVDSAVSEQSQSHETVSQSHAESHADDAPWVAAGVSKATWYRQKNKTAATP